MGNLTPRKGSGMLLEVFNPTGTRYEVVPGRPQWHKVNRVWSEVTQSQPQICERHEASSMWDSESSSFILERVFVVITDGGDETQAAGVEALWPWLDSSDSTSWAVENFGTTWMRLKKCTWPSPITPRADLPHALATRPSLHCLHQFL